MRFKQIFRWFNHFTILQKCSNWVKTEYKFKNSSKSKDSIVYNAGIGCAVAWAIVGGYGIGCGVGCETGCAHGCGNPGCGGGDGGGGCGGGCGG